MRHQEVHVPTLRGGILADEMGMVCVAAWNEGNGDPRFALTHPFVLS